MTGGGVAQTTVRLDVDREVIRQFCVKHGIRELALFGSVVRDDFKPESDVDVLVEFESGWTPSLFGHMDLQEELAALFGHKVDLVSKRGLSPHLRERILASREVLYGGKG